MGFAGQGLEDDVVEVAEEVTPGDGVGERGLGGAAWRGGEGLAGREGIGGGDECADLLRGSAAGAEREGGGQEALEDDAERVDIGGGGDRFAADLFGAGVFEGHGPEGRALGGGVGGVIGGEDGSDAEVEQFGCAVAGDEDVGGFEVAVDDESLVGVVDGVADLDEEFESVAGGKVSGKTVFINWLTRDVFHGDPGPAIGCGTGVDEAGDVGVVEDGEGVSFSVEAAEEVVGVEPFSDDFYGDGA